MASEDQANTFGNIQTVFKNLGMGKIIALLCLVAATVAGASWIVSWSGTPEFELLYSNLSPEDAGEIVMKLKEHKVPYEISANGKAILVPKKELYELRLVLANEGLPQGTGVGFEIFDNAKLGMTEFVQNVNYQRALQGELSRTINGFDEVESSRIHIVMPSDSLFVEDKEVPTASVVLRLRRGRKLSENQIQGIVHLVSASVSQLEPENVTIVDNKGRMLAGFEDKSTVTQLSLSQFEYQENVEQNLEKRVDSMLENVLGAGKSITRVSCSLDFRRHEKTEEAYDPEGKVVRSEQIMNTISNKSGSGQTGVPGVASNIPTEGEGINTPDSLSSEKPEYQKQDRTVNYEIGKVTSHTVEPVGRIVKISIAVVVDGIHELITGDEGESEWKYTPRSQDDLTKIENMVKRAVNFDAERGDEINIVNISFEIEEQKEGDEEVVEKGMLDMLEEYREYIKYALMSVFLLLIFLFVVRPLVKWLTAVPGGSGDMLKQLPMTISEIEKGYGEGGGALPYRDQALKMLMGEEEGTVSIAKEWLAEK